MEESKKKKQQYRISISLSPVQYHKLYEYSKNEGLPKSTVISIALSDFFHTREWAFEAGQDLIETFKKNPEMLEKIVNQSSPHD